MFIIFQCEMNTTHTITTQMMREPERGRERLTILIHHDVGRWIKPLTLAAPLPPVLTLASQCER